MTSIIKVDEIQNKAGTSAFDIRSNGIVNNKVPCGFSVGLVNATDQTGIPTNTYTKAEYVKTNVDHAFDTHNGWSDTDHTYTVPTNCGGYWLLNVWAEFDRASETNIVTITRGTTVSNTNAFHYVRGVHVSNPQNASNPTPNIQFVVSLPDGQAIHTQVYHTYGSNATLLAPDAGDDYLRCGMQGWRLF